MQTKDFRRAYEAFVAKQEKRSLPEIDIARPEFSAFGRFSRSVIARLPTNWKHGPRSIARMSITVMSTPLRELVRNLGRDGWLKHTAPARARRTRSTFARWPWSAKRWHVIPASRILPSRCRAWRRPNFVVRHARSKSSLAAEDRSGAAIAAFALSEPASGSDVANISMTAQRSGDGFTLDGEKTWISNGGIADLYVVFARTGEAAGAKGLSAFIVRGENPGLSSPSVSRSWRRIRSHAWRSRIAVSAPTISSACRRRLQDSDGDARCLPHSVGAAALGFRAPCPRRNDQRAKSRELIRRSIGGIADGPGPHCRHGGRDRRGGASCLSRAWTKDTGAARVTREAAMAKLYATEAAQRVIDAAVQIHGGDGVRSGHPVETLYREIRALRIYEGASDVRESLSQDLRFHRGEAVT